MLTRVFTAPSRHLVARLQRLGFFCRRRWKQLRRCENISGRNDSVLTAGTAGCNHSVIEVR